MPAHRNPTKINQDQAVIKIYHGNLEIFDDLAKITDFVGFFLVVEAAILPKTIRIRLLLTTNYLQSLEKF